MLISKNKTIKDNTSKVPLLISVDFFDREYEKRPQVKRRRSTTTERHDLDQRNELVLEAYFERMGNVYIKSRKFAHAMPALL